MDSIPEEEKEVKRCLNCEKEFYIKYTNKVRPRKFCNRQCYYEHWKITREVKICLRCNNEYKSTSTRQKWCLDCAPTLRDRKLLSKYQINQKDFDLLYLSQNGRCAICDINSIDCVDHSHNTGVVRGLLCRGCNAQLGIMENQYTSEWLDIAMKYLSQEILHINLQEYKLNITREDKKFVKNWDTKECIHCFSTYTPTTFTQKWCVQCAPSKKFAALLYNYGIGRIEWDAIYKLQQESCKICRDKTELFLDHCHKTGKIRGLICPKCNFFLHLLEDNKNKNWIEKANFYLGMCND